MSAVRQDREELEEGVQLSPEHRLIFDLISGIKNELRGDMETIHKDIKEISGKLNTHLGFHEGVQMKEKSTVLEIVRSLVSLFKEQPLILVVLAGMVLLVSADTLSALRGFLPW